MFDVFVRPQNSISSCILNNQKIGIMPVEIVWRQDVGRKVENFFNNAGYKEYLENAVAFNRKLNEERKMRLPYIDGQTGVAQRHYNSQRVKRERMPGCKPGQIYSYPQKIWRKKRYQYLKYFMQTRRIENPDQLAISQGELSNPGGVPGITSINEDSNMSLGKDEVSRSEWSYYDDIFQEGEDDFLNSNSDSEYDESYSKKKQKSSKKSLKARGGSKVPPGFGPTGSATPASKRRSNTEQVPDSEKPFSCDYCGVKYKTRPGLTYHTKTAHKDKDGNLLNSTITINQNPNSMAPLSAATAALAGEDMMPEESPNPMLGMPPGRHGHGGPFADLSGPRFQPTASPIRPVLRPNHPPMNGSSKPEPPKNVSVEPPKTKADGKEIATPIGYCDFCLGDESENKKTNQPEELVSCAECGRSGHPTCLQFTENMLISVKKYAWQCIECKCCTICGTAENDDQLLFCDDCDRGYHMYCLVPKIKEPPEGSWSCKNCLETFHS